MSDHLIDTVDLDIRLDPNASRITAVLALRPNPAGMAGAPLVLNGDEKNLVGVRLDGEPLPAEAYAPTPSGLSLHAPPQLPFTLTVDTLCSRDQRRVGCRAWRSSNSVRHRTVGDLELPPSIRSNAAITVFSALRPAISSRTKFQLVAGCLSTR
ncbi:hypothetical protein [Methylobacterium haplocladii]|uniref:Uncharacterized protein n=1 Tax=Methylobacterium haplocladii TaxID=1176176 RepID=A0A512IWE5_9HYPH|nr:hypothetical protein [Methylobacterium haplocladii]GEP01929.1 hypothetical protein MHA02_43160 [Methylobacterium haplocladii]GLS61358.1 hypothetical protein GCM10007887_40650 [Methylobacterium haplocladii]